MDDTRKNKTIPVGEALPALPSEPPAAPIPEFDVDAYTRARIREGLVERYKKMFTETMRETDWSRVHPENAAAVKKVREWKKAPGGKGLLLIGKTGLFKTRSMVSLIGRLMCEDGLDVRHYKANDWFAKLQSQISFGRDDAEEWVRAVAARPLVYIDDLGQEAVLKSREEWSQGWFFDFCDRRIEANLPLLITSNLTAEEILESQSETRGDPLLRRLLELCEPVKFV